MARVARSKSPCLSNSAFLTIECIGEISWNKEDLFHASQCVFTHLQGDKLHRINDFGDFALRISTQHSPLKALAIVNAMSRALFTLVLPPWSSSLKSDTFQRDG